MENTRITKLSQNENIAPFSSKVTWICIFQSNSLFCELKAAGIEFLNGLPEDVAGEGFAPPDNPVIIDNKLDEMHRCVFV